VERLDERLDGLMEVVKLTGLISREGGWGAVASWGDTMSLGAPLASSPCRRQPSELPVVNSRSETPSSCQAFLPARLVCSSALPPRSPRVRLVALRMRHPAGTAASHHC